MTHLPSAIPRRHLPWRAAAFVTLVAALLVDGAGAQRINTSALPNFDIRTERSTEAARYVERVASAAAAALPVRSAARAQGLAALQADVRGVEVVESPTLATLEVVSAKPGQGFLTGPGIDRVGTMRGFLSRYSDAYGVSATEMDGLTVVSNYVNPAGNMAWVEMAQAINGIPVWQGTVRGGFTADGALARTTGVLASVFDQSTLATTPSFGAAQAVARGAGSVGWTQYANANARAWLVYFPVTHGAARLAWAMELWGDPDVFLMVIDAEDGTVLFRKNATNYQTQSASYNVFNNDSPAPMSPSTMLPGSGTQASYIARVTLSLIGNEGPLSFNNLGWMTDDVNAGNGWTDGNNVQAGLDIDGTDGIESVAVGAGRVFDADYDPSVDAPSTSDYRNGEITHQFYWSNKFHDALYLLGFTEAAGNFQDDNFGRGGVQADRISAEAQDSPGVNNANFTTLPDGTRGRMQMYIFDGPDPDRTSGLDNDILLHELTHGASNRLHGNATGLITTMSGGLGEGWSDFYARALLSTAGENVNGIYSIGGWVTNQMFGGAYTDNYYYGIRRFPYAVKTNLGTNGKPHNPLTLADIDPAQVNLTDGAYTEGPAGSSNAFQVHNIGEVWASALFEVRARFINRLGWATGNQRILQFVTDGMKLDPLSPTMLQGRDSIIVAAAAGGGTAADIADIWAGFATRGMGLSAQALGTSSGTVTEAFDVPGIAGGSSSLTAESTPNGRVDPNETVSMSLCVVNNGGSTSGTVNGTLLASGGVTSPSGPQGFGTIGAGASVCRTFSFTVNTSCSGTVNATLAMTESGGPSKNLVFPVQVGSPVVIFSEAFDGVGAPGLPAGWTTSTLTGTTNLWVTSTTSPDTAPNKVMAGNPATVSDNVLESPVIAMPAGAATLTFRNTVATEHLYDGGVLEISIDGGPYEDTITAGGNFVIGGYQLVLNASQSPLAGRQAWSGAHRTTITTIVNMPVASQGQNIQLRWRMASDEFAGNAGWAIDTVVLRLTAFECGGPPPGAFSKTTPTHGAVNQPMATMLTWGVASGATGYEYCIDTTNNNACNTSWVSTGAATSVTLSPRPANTVHFWQVRANNGDGTTYADGALTAFWAFQTGSPGPSFGQVDTPAQNAAGVQGAIGVTGWALDDGGVVTVKIYRNCLGFDVPSNCQNVLGNSVVYIGDAAFLAGARPDVAAAFPTHPQNGRAGWGHLLLTPMLPHVPNSQAFGGQGPLSVYVVATDTNANQTLLGRTFVPGPGFNTPTAFSMTNDTIAKPFGAIDTPGQGQTIGGIFNNFGWAITPDGNTVPDAGDIFIPTDGSTMTVFIDSLPVAQVAYNQCRGTVGNPPPSGVFCDDDVSNIFGNLTPQPANAPRASNPTKYRNLDAARGPIGAYTFDTTLMSNGLHTIAWSVTDSAGRNEGIGSRFFIVDNAGPGLDALRAASEKDALRAASEKDAAARVVGTADSLVVNLPATDGVWGRTGFNLSAPWAVMHADEDASFVVRLPELSRMELWLGTDVEAGYLVAEGKLHPLPVGASLTGPQFAWMPPPGYTGTYELAFIRGGDRITVKVTVIERPKAVEGERQIRMEMAADARLSEVRVEGTAFDPNAAIGAGIDAVHVWAARVDGPAVRGSVGPWVPGAASPVFLGEAALDRDRFSLTAKLAPGTYMLTAYAWNQRTERWEDSRSVTVVVR